MKLAYYPGCSLESTAIEYDISTHKIMEKLGVEFKEIPDWNCCGASPAHQTDQNLPIALVARNLAIAEKEGLDVAVPCTACYNRMKAAEKTLKEDKSLLTNIEEAIGMNYGVTNTAKSLLEVVAKDIGVEKIATEVKKKLSGLRIACYYGCLLVKPQSVTSIDDPENPKMMDSLMEAIGATPVKWSHKTECCGAGLSIARTDIVLKLSNDILDLAQANGADCLVTACPLCQLNLEMRQAEIEKKYNVKYNLPVFYFTELIGLSMGLDAKELGIQKHFINPLPLLKDKQIV